VNKDHLAPSNVKRKPRLSRSDADGRVQPDQVKESVDTAAIQPAAAVDSGGDISAECTGPAIAQVPVNPIKVGNQRPNSTHMPPAAGTKGLSAHSILSTAAYLTALPEQIAALETDVATTKDQLALAQKEAARQKELTQAAELREQSVRLQLTEAQGELKVVKDELVKAKEEIERAERQQLVQKGPVLEGPRAETAAQNGTRPAPMSDAEADLVQRERQLEQRQREVEMIRDALRSKVDESKQVF
jgi:hypothetical protein